MYLKSYNGYEIVFIKFLLRGSYNYYYNYILDSKKYYLPQFKAK